MDGAYDKARRLFALFSGILIVWEYIGIKVGSNLKLPVINMNVELKHPEAIPVVILILVLYFAYRFTLEWTQYSRQKRFSAATIVDFSITCTVGLVAILIYMFQQISGFRLADVLTAYSAFSIIAGVITVLIVYVIHVAIISKEIYYKYIVWLLFIDYCISIVLMVAFFSILIMRPELLVASFVGVTIFVICNGVIIKINVKKA